MSIRTTKLNPIYRLSFDSRLIVIGLFFLAGCGAPGEPVPPSPPIPAAVNDLKAVQAGGGAQLSFTLPRKTTGGEQLDETPAVEILRGTTLPDGQPDAKSFHVVGHVPGALVQSFISAGRMRYFDPLPPATVEAHPGIPFFYRVRTRVSPKFASADSNTVIVPVFPVADRIEKLEAVVTETAVVLSWPAPAHTSGGKALSEPITYAVYRGELDPAAADAASSDISKAVWKGPLQQIGKPASNNFRDAGFEFGKTYVYLVRSVTTTGTNMTESVQTESADSVAAIVTPQDIFPPAAPQNVVAAILPGTNAESVSVELSWSISVEADLAGYRIYRSDEEGARGMLLTSELLLTPAYRDNSVAIGHHYWYTITAVDRWKNESQPNVASVMTAAPSL